MSPERTRTFDAVVIGGGIFGIYAALHFARKGLHVALLEKESQLFTKASMVNQARLHGGYHYPRSIATARMSDEHRVRFTEEHRPFINFRFEKYYAIDRFGSLTDAAQFERFCNYLGIECRRIEAHPLFNFERIEALYATVEHSFDPVLMANHYRRQVAQEGGIRLFLSTRIEQAERAGDAWLMEATRLDARESFSLRAPLVVNATYSATNAVNRLFGLPPIELMHEISEIALLTSPDFDALGLTVMDGPFASIMPFGKTGLLSLSSVAYTHHKVSYEAAPHFDCMDQVAHCRPEFQGQCNACPAHPRSHYRKMLAQIRQYFHPEVRFRYYHSLFTIKSKLKANFIDDGRPTEVVQLHQKPDFWCVFAGKVNSIYEVEKIPV